MSAGLDLVRSIYADWERGDFSSVEWAHPEIEWVIADWPTPGTWKGVTGMAEGWREVASAYVDWRMPVDEYRELDDERVLVLVGMAARGKTSGIDARELAPRPAHLLHVCDRKVTRFVDYWDRESAFADLDLEE
jgi:ketosteroid isomerase-like protein